MTGTTGDGDGQTLGAMAGTGMTEPGTPGAGDGVGTTRGTMDITDTTVLTTITGEEAHGTGLTMITIADTEPITPVEAVSEPEAAAWAAQPASLLETTDTGLSAVHTAEPLPLEM